jgi:glycosyltransferase involved in cell wall biosynthesis
VNILYLTNHLNIGGITSYVLTLAEGLKQRGHNVYISSSGGAVLPEFINANINYIRLPIKTKSEISPKILISLFKLFKIIKEKDIDVIHANTRVTCVLASLTRYFSGCPYVSTCHGFFKQRFFRKVFPCWGKRIIAISESVKGHLINDFKVDDKKIAVIHNGINIEQASLKFVAPLKKRLGLANGPVIGIVARLSEEKGHTYLIEAMQRVITDIAEAQLLIVGDGRMKERLLSLSQALRIEKNVLFLPSVFDTKEVLPAMDIFVLPSLKEGLGLSLMEAMASGLAVIGSNIGGIKSLIKDGFNGLLVEPASVDDLFQAILYLLKNPEKAESIGRNAQIFIKENFSSTNMIDKTERVYLECLREKD